MTTQLERDRRLRLADNEWILHFVWSTNPIPMNGPKANWRAKSRMSRQVRDTTYKLALVARIPEMTRCEVQLTWWVKTNHRRDVDNLGLFEKPMYDALVDAGIVRDDTPDLMVKQRPVIVHLDQSEGLVSEPCFTLRVTCLEPCEEFEL